MSTDMLYEKKITCNNKKLNFWLANKFQEGIVTEPTSLGSELMPSSNVGYYSDAEGRGAASRTPDNLATIARRPLSTMRNPNYDSEQWPADNMAATSTNITPDVNIR